MEQPPSERAALRQAHAVVKQRTRLVYAPPQLTALPAGATVAAAATRLVTLREARQDRDLSIQQLSEQSGISPATIYRIETGRTRPRPYVVFALSEFLRLTPDQVVEFRGRIAPSPLNTRR